MVHNHSKELCGETMFKGGIPQLVFMLVLEKVFELNSTP